MIISRDWKKNEMNRVPRRRAPRAFVNRANVQAPMRNEAMETRDRAQPFGAPRGCFEAPRPRTMVFPINAISVLLGRWET